MRGLAEPLELSLDRTFCLLSIVYDYGDSLDLPMLVASWPLLDVVSFYNDLNQR